MFCQACGRRWDRVIKARDRKVACPACGSLRVGVIPPCKIIESRGPRHYNTAGSGRERQVPEPVFQEPKARKIIKLQDLREAAEEYDDVEIVEELG